MESEPLTETPLLHGQSLEHWHQWLITNQDTGENTAHHHVPCSRYGDNGEEVSWWALAAEWVYVEANGEDDDVEVSLDHLMGLAVNDHPDLADLVLDYWYCIPEQLKQQLGDEEDIRQLIEEEVR